MLADTYFLLLIIVALLALLLGAILGVSLTRPNNNRY
jgi:hypothetical protein